MQGHPATPGTSLDNFVVHGPVLGTIVETSYSADGIGYSKGLVVLSGDPAHPTRTGVAGSSSFASGGIIRILKVSDDFQVWSSPDPATPAPHYDPQRQAVPLAYPSAPTLPQFLPYADPAPKPQTIPIAPNVAPTPTISPNSPVPLRDPLAPAYPQTQPQRSPVPLAPPLLLPGGTPSPSPTAAPGGSPAGAPDPSPYAQPKWADPTADPKTGTPGDTKPKDPQTKDPIDCCAEILAGQLELAILIKKIAPAHDCCDEILSAVDDVKSLLTEDVNFSINSVNDKCVSKTYRSNDKGIKGLNKQIEQLAMMVDDQKIHECDNPAIAAVPEWWQVRLGADRPQLVIQFGHDLGNGKIDSPCYPLSIPHVNISAVGSRSPISPYTKGQWEAILTLADNSKVIVNAVNAAEAESVINQAKAIITPSALVGSFIKIGQRKGQALSTIRVIAKIAKYFPTGQKNMKPEWVRYYTNE